MNGFKQTEIGLIPEDWEVVKLGEVGEIITGNTPSKRKREYWENGEIDFIKPPDLKNSYIKTFSEKISSKAQKVARIVPEGSVLVSCIGIIGRVGYTLKPVAFNQQINAIVPNDKVDKLFLFYMLQTQTEQINRLRSFTTVPIVNKSKFSEIKIPLPPLEEQQKIAKVLDKIQQAIEIQDRIIEETKNLKKSLMQKLFTEGLYGEEQKETEIGLIPKSWEVVRFENAILKEKIKVGKIKQQEYENFGKYPIVDQSQNYIAGFSNDEKKVYKGPLPVIIFGDHTRIFKFVDFPFIVGADGVKILIPNQKIYDPLFLFFALLNLDIPNRGYNRHYSILKEKKLPLPPLEEQKEIAHILSTVDKKIEIEQKKKELLKELFKTMLHKLMSGEIRLKDVEL